jgi:hypothetical protein
MWKYIDDGSPMGDATQLALTVAVSILLVALLLSLVTIMRRNRVARPRFQGADVEGAVGANRDAI